MWARVEKHEVIEVIDFDPKGLFHSGITWAECGEEVKVGWSYDGATFEPPNPEIIFEKEKTDRMNFVGATGWGKAGAKTHVLTGLPVSLSTNEGAIKSDVQDVEAEYGRRVQDSRTSAENKTAMIQALDEGSDIQDAARAITYSILLIEFGSDLPTEDDISNDPRWP